tara:strand:+ start:140 stop:478 length:339 start_codon:yes stop_codon:yes gene_type:complete
MKVLKKIGLGIISLGLISTFYIPEAKASETVIEFLAADTKNYAIKQKSNGQYLLKKIGSGNQQCKMYLSDPVLGIFQIEILESFVECVITKAIPVNPTIKEISQILLDRERF